MEEMQVFPNPTSGIVNVDRLTDNEGVFVVTDFSGRVVLSEQLNEGISTHTIDLSTLPDGLYMLRDSAGGMKKLVLER